MVHLFGTRGRAPSGRASKLCVFVDPALSSLCNEEADKGHSEGEAANKPQVQTADLSYRSSGSIQAVGYSIRGVRIDQRDLGIRARWLATQSHWASRLIQVSVKRPLCW